MSVSAVQNLVTGEYFKKNEMGYILFCGELGDPMMHPDIEEIIDICLGAVPRIEIATNGGLRQPDWYEKIAKKYGNRIHIKWAIDGTDHKTNWKYREGVDFKRAMSNMKAWIKNGGAGDWHFLIFD
jgi:MoaA/NifB/PqqE/SkfB family radical SAM enzyme